MTQRSRNLWRFMTRCDSRAWNLFNAGSNGSVWADLAIGLSKPRHRG